MAITTQGGVITPASFGLDASGVIQVASPLTSNVTFSGNWSAYLAGPPAISNLTIEFLGSTTAVSVFTVDATGVGSGVPVEIIIPASATLTNVEVIGGPEADTISGGGGRDTLTGGAGNDTITGGNTGTLGDVLSGGDGDDSIIGSTGTSGATNTRIEGGAGEDTIRGSNGSDVIFGGDDNDFIDGRGAADRIFGEGGNDTITGGQQSDTVDGGDGDDVITDGNGLNRISGGLGNDTITTSGALNTRHTIDGGDGDDVITGNQNGRINATGGDGNDIITGSNATQGGERLNGGIGDDTLRGRRGPDSLTGGSGNDDFIYAQGDGRDTISDFGDGIFGDFDTSNNDFLDLSTFYNKANLDAYNAATGSNVINSQELLRLDASDGTLDGIFSGDNQQSILGFAGSDGIVLQGSLNLATAAIAEIQDAFNVVCFGKGTQIETAAGPKAVEALTKGDLVWTYDNGLQPIRWIGSRSFSSDELNKHPKLRPFRIDQGALGENMPSQSLVVSPQHRILMHNDIAERMFGDKEVLVAAKHLGAIKGIAPFHPADGIDYFHILLERHEVILANGALSETLFWVITPKKH